MPTVETVRGPVDTADLGFTLPHEHIISGAHSVRINWPHTFDRDAEVAWALEKLEEAYDQGVSARWSTSRRSTSAATSPSSARSPRARGCRSSSPPGCAPLRSRILPPPRARRHRRPVRHGHRAGHRRHRYQGRRDQSRHRGGGDAADRADAARGRAHASRDRRADPDPLEPLRRHRRQPAGRLRGGGRRPLAHP